MTESTTHDNAELSLIFHLSLAFHSVFLLSLPLILHPLKALLVHQLLLLFFSLFSDLHLLIPHCTFTRFDVLLYLLTFQVNGVDVSECSHEEAVQRFLEAQEPIMVEVKRRSRSEVKDTEANVIVPIAEEEKQAYSSGRDSEDDGLAIYPDFEYEVSTFQDLVLFKYYFPVPCLSNNMMMIQLTLVNSCLLYLYATLRPHGPNDRYFLGNLNEIARR